jgi:FkbM family methyltransferase
MTTEYYSQNDEEKIITDYLLAVGLTSGRVLDIGAYNPTVFSNSRKLIEQGWKGILIEPSPPCFESIEKFYLGNENVECLNLAIATFDGTLSFYDSPGACATASEEHYLKWKDTIKDYKKIEVPCITWKSFYKMFPGTYEFISIDTEGLDYDIIKQIDLNQTKTEIVCIEYTYKGNEIFKYIKHFGFQGINQNGENLIMVRI